MADKPIKLLLTYKSGRVVPLLVEDWKIRYDQTTGDLTHIEITYHDKTPNRIVYWGLPHIESITKEA